MHLGLDLDFDPRPWWHVRRRDGACVMRRYTRLRRWYGRWVLGETWLRPAMPARPGR